MKKLITGLLLSIAVLGSASCQETTKPYKWMIISGAMIRGAKAYVDIYSFRTGQTDRGMSYNTATVLISFNTPLTVTGNRGTQKSGSSIISHMVIDCNTGTAGVMRDDLLTEKMPTKENLPVASTKYSPTSDNTFHLEKGSPMRAALCPETI